MSFVPLHVHSHYSLLDGLSKPHSIAERCANLGYSACALTDHGSLAGTITFINALNDVCKCGHQKTIHADKKKKCSQKGCTCEEFVPYKVKPILGCEFYISEKDAKVKEPSNRQTTGLVVLSKNIQGWKALIKASSESARPQNVYYNKQRIDAPSLSAYSKQDWFVLSGHLGSYIGNVIFGPAINAALAADTYEEAKSYIRDDWKSAIISAVGAYNELFGKGNFYLAIDLTNAKHQPAAVIVAKTLRWVGKKLGIPCAASCNSYYATKQQAIDQRMLLCMKFKATFANVESKIQYDSTASAFFKSNSFYIPSEEDVSTLYEPEEIQNASLIAEAIESYKILGKPYLPVFDCPDGLAPDEYLKKLCASGWNKLVEPVLKREPDKRSVYSERIKLELDVLCGAGLASYFLIVQDYCNWAREQGWLLGPGRGSCAGSLTSYLLGISSADPLPPSLIFERFYNAGRNTPDRVALPDIDSDFPKFHRDEIIEYIQKKFGYDKVSQMITFGTIKGRGGIKAVLGIHQACSFDEANKISKTIPQESSIADQLQLMREATGESSAIRWVLENNPESLRDYCYLTEAGELDGPLAKLFEQAIRLEGTKKQSGKHASGIIISRDPLAEVCPMAYDKNDDQIICGMEMGDLELMGHVKFDILGVAVLDKIMGVAKLLKYGTLDEIDSSNHYG